MRLDKFLKVSRIIKRRSIAKEVCDQGRVMVNGRPAKAGIELKVGDELRIDFARKILTVKVSLLQETSKKDLAANMYEVLEEEIKEKEPDEFWNELS